MNCPCRLTTLQGPDLREKPHRPVILSIRRLQCGNPKIPDNSKDSLSDTWIRRLKNHPAVVVAVVAGVTSLTEISAELRRSYAQEEFRDLRKSPATTPQVVFLQPHWAAQEVSI